MLLNNIRFDNVDKNLYNKNDIDLEWRTFGTEDKRRVLYSVREDGLVIATTKKTYKEKILKPVLSEGNLVVKINRKLYRIKHLVAQYFCRGYKEGMCVLLKDGNPYNCSKKNLIICSKEEASKRASKLANNGKPIKVNGVEYNSITQFCKDNYIGRSVFYEAVNQKHKTSILDDYEIIIK